MSLRNPVTPPEIDSGTVRLVAQHLNHYATPGPHLRSNLWPKKCTVWAQNLYNDFLHMYCIEACCNLDVSSTSLFMSTLNTDVVCFSETSEPPTRLHGVTTHKPTLSILNMANTTNAFSAPVHTGGSEVTSMKSRNCRRALEDNRTNFERRTNERTAREIRNISRHDVRTAVRHFAAETAICYRIAFVQDIGVDSRPITHTYLDLS
jgi:hypothetical protein